MKNIWQRFWNWYDRWYVVNVTVALALFALQMVHLVWLGGEVVAHKALGAPLFTFEGIWQALIVLVDFTEIPALFTMSLVYIDAFRHGRRFNAVLMLALLHSQWLHIFWITDEFVVGVFQEGHAPLMSPLLAWVAILIDYLEVPVIADTCIKLYRALKERSGLAGVREALNEA